LGTRDTIFCASTTNQDLKPNDSHLLSNAASLLMLVLNLFLYLKPDLVNKVGNSRLQNCVMSSLVMYTLRHGLRYWSETKYTKGVFQ